MTEKKVIETQYGWYQKNDDKVNVDEIIGIVKTDEQTNSVQLKKEAQLSICEKRVLELEKENEQLKTFKSKVFKLIDDSIKIYEDTTTNDEFLQIQLDTKLQTLYNLRKELQE